MKPLSLKLRGAVGIHDGLGLDDVSIDFGGFQSGLIALVGPNGSGKTTILENLHPYLQLASREGSLSNHFRLRDSYRDFTFELAGHVYRSYILIDAKTAKTEAYLYRDGTPLSDGKVNTYKAEIEKLLGSPELFFRSIFSCQNERALPPSRPGRERSSSSSCWGCSGMISMPSTARSRQMKWKRISPADVEGSSRSPRRPHGRRLSSLSWRTAGRNSQSLRRT